MWKKVIRFGQICLDLGKIKSYIPKTFHFLRLCCYQAIMSHNFNNINNQIKKNYFGSC